MKRITILIVLVAAAAQFPVHADEEVDLIDNMRALQYHAHKAALTIDKRNLRLAHFYEHELEEALEETVGIEAYHDQPIGQLTRAMLLPAFARFAEALDAAKPDWERISKDFDRMIDACNSCHQATGYGFIRIQRTRANPFMQSFEPVESK
jgi:cytochrome c553